jgi:hypothetical protein
MSKTKIDYNSNVNQDIKRKFVEREIKTCFSYEMETILRAGQEGQKNKDYPLPSYEDIQNLYLPQCQNCGYQGKFEQVEADEKGNGKFNKEKIVYLCPECRQETDEEPETEAQEIFEWWIITEWLAKKLQDKDEPILDWGNNFYWGRTCTGQAILLDGVISDICEELEILEGQKNDWNKYK